MDLRSSLPGISWPAVLTGPAAQLVGLLYQFDTTQWWPAEALRAHQFRQLRILLEHAARTVPFHAERLRAAGIDPRAPLTEAAWSRLPVLRRTDVQQAGDRLHSNDVPAEHGGVGMVSSGGSTGIPVRVRKTALDDVFWNAACLREELWHRDNPLGTIARLRGIPSGSSEEHARMARSLGIVP